MDAQNTSFLIHFRQLEDPRLNRKKRHRTIGLAAMVMVCNPFRVVRKRKDHKDNNDIKEGARFTRRVLALRAVSSNWISGPVLL